MKLGLLACALAAALGAVACGGNGSLVSTGCDPDDAYCPPGPPRGGTSTFDSGSPRDSGVSVHEAGDAGPGGDAGPRGDAGPVESGADGGSPVDGGANPANPGEAGAPEAGPGLCAPGAACGGLWECRDDCYTGKCCVLACNCTDPAGQSGTLECSMTCP